MANGEKEQNQMKGQWIKLILETPSFPTGFKISNM